MRLCGQEDNDGVVLRVGRYTTQRFSDYSLFTVRNISFHDGVGIITLTQQKTGTEVSIPILNDNLIRIFEKYDYNLPYIHNNDLNEIIKVVLKKLSESVPSLRQEMATKITLISQRMEEQNRVAFKRNEYGDILVPRYRLATTHTARRTGITLMYLSKMLDSHEMMSISGHKTESVFNDYIKISGIELATSIAKKVAKAKQEAEVKSVLLEQFGQMSAEQLAGLLELAKTGTAG